jgi:hypothetical protein
MSLLICHKLVVLRLVSAKLGYIKQQYKFAISLLGLTQKGYYLV